MDPTLRSLFSPFASSADRAALGYGAPGGGAGAGQGRHNKPSFGLVFAQLLDVHLLASRVPRGRDDVDVLLAAALPPSSLDAFPGTAAELLGQVRYVWLVEVLLDDAGVWEQSSTGQGAGPRGGGAMAVEQGGGDEIIRWGCRERRWGVVDLLDGRRVVDAFPKGSGGGGKGKGPVRVAGGFGGLRV